MWAASQCCHDDELSTKTESMTQTVHLLGKDRRFGSKVGQIGPKWDKSGAFSDQISVHLARGAKCAEI